MSPTRSKANKDVKRGIDNRVKGIFKKANFLRSAYGIRIAIAIIPNNDIPVGFQSQPGLLRQVSSLKFSAGNLRGPDQYDTVAERSGSTEESDHTSSGVPTPVFSAGPLSTVAPVGVSPPAENTMSQAGFQTPLTLQGTTPSSTSEWDDKMLDESPHGCAEMGPWRDNGVADAGEFETGMTEAQGTNPIGSSDSTSATLERQQCRQTLISLAEQFDLFH